MRLIDGDTVALFLVEKGQRDIKRFKLGELIKYTPSEVGELIKEMPTIDPVKKGKWIKSEGSLWNMANCSECGEMCVLGDTAKFCPFCGATMVGVITKKRGKI